MLVTAADLPTLGRGLLTLGCHWPAHAAAVGLSSPASSRVAHHYRSVIRLPPTLPIRSLLEKNCDCVRQFREVKILLCTKSQLITL
jgi:hypothetical protein